MLMTVSDVAAYLKLSDKTVLKLVKHGEIPCTKIANQWRFSTPVLNEWIAGQMMLASGEDQAEESRITESLRSCKIAALEGHTLWTILRELADRAVEGGMIEEPQLFVEDLIRHDGIASTVLGSGVLLLHLNSCPVPLIKASGIAAGYTEKGLSIPCLSERKARLVLLYLSAEPEKNRTVLCRLMDELSDNLRVRKFFPQAFRK